MSKYILTNRLREFSSESGIWQVSDICQDAADRIELLESLLRRVKECNETPSAVDLPDDLAIAIDAALQEDGGA